MSDTSHRDKRPLHGPCPRQHVVGVPVLFAATRTRQMTCPTTDQSAQQVRVSRIVAAGILLVLGKLALHQIKLFLSDNSWNLSHGFPLLWPGGPMASVIMTNGS